jgi:hypothetical protein
MSQCSRVLDVLADGRSHDIAEIHARAGTMRLNSRVAELRERGHVIRCDVRRGVYSYVLLSRESLGRGERASDLIGAAADVEHAAPRPEVATETERGSESADTGAYAADTRGGTSRPHVPPEPRSVSAAQLSLLPPSREYQGVAA